MTPAGRVCTGLRIGRMVALLGLWLSANAAHAQTPVVNPTTLSFVASTDHDATLPVSGTPVLTDYEARYYPASSCNPDCPTTAPAFTLALGKPTPDAQRLITVKDIFQGLVLNTPYKAVVVAKGPNGTSGPSNVTVPFGVETPRTPAPVSNLTVSR
jgi:hypothetical protein